MPVVKKFIPVLIVLMIITGCDQFFDQARRGEFYPLSDGNEWIYRGSDDQGAWEERYMINGTTKHYGGFTVYVEEWYYNNTPQPPSYLYQDDSGLYIYYFLDSYTYFQLLKFPLELNNEWEFDYGIDTYEMKYTAIEDVVVPAGTFTDTYRVLAKHNKEPYLIYWYKMGIGIIKYEWIGEEVLELRAYTLN